MHLAYAWRLAVRHYPVILLLALLGALASFAYTSVAGSYTSTTYLTVRPTEADRDVRAVDPSRFFETETRAILGDEILGAAVASLRDGTTVEQLRRGIELGDGSSSDVLGVTVSGRTAQQAQARRTAVLSAVAAHRFPDVSLTDLWTSEMVGPPRTKALAAGLAGGIAGGTLLVLLWGAARRPVFHPRYLQLDEDARTYPVVLDLHHPEEVQRFLTWLGRPVGRIVAVGRSDAQASRLAARVESNGDGPALLVATVGRATERAIEEHASLAANPSTPTVVLVSSKRQRRQR